MRYADDLFCLLAGIYDAIENFIDGEMGDTQTTHFEHDSLSSLLVREKSM